VDEHPVTRNELRFHMSMEKTNVINYFFMTHDANLNTGSWTREYGGERPDTVLRERAVQRVTEAKTLQILALEHGISTDISYRGMQRERTTLNRQRRAAFEAGEVLYGIVEFVPMTYYLQVMSNFRSGVHEALANDHVVVEEQQVRDMFDEYYDVYNNEENFRIAELFIAYLPPGMPASDLAQLSYAQAERLMWEIYQRLLDGEDFDEISLTYTGDLPIEGTLAAGSGAGRTTGSTAMLVHHAATLGDGEFSRPFENGFGFSIIKMLDSAAQVETSYEEAFNFLFPIVMERNIDEYLSRRTENANVVINSFVFNKVGVP